MTSKPKESSVPKGEAVLDALVSALELSWESAGARDVESLPEILRDPLRVMERGQELLKSGLKFLPKGSVCAASYDNEFRMAARNGGVIPDRVISRMRLEREAAEAQIPMEFDESR